MGIELYKQEQEQEQEQELKQIDLFVLEGAIGGLLNQRLRGKNALRGQELFNLLIRGLKDFKFMGNKLFNGFKVAYFMGLLKDAKKSEIITPKESARVSKFLNNCYLLKQEMDGIEIIQKDNITEVNLVSKRSYNWE